MKTLFLATALVFGTLALDGRISTASAQGTAFTYQGRLNSGGVAASGNYDVAFTLYITNTTGMAWAGPVTNLAVAVTNGLFTTEVDFGSGIFTGNNFWLELAVRTNGGTSFSALTPRQPLTPTPYAIFANSASNLLGTLPANQLTGPIPATSLSGTIPATNLSGTYNGAVTFNNGANMFDGTFIGQFLGSSFIGGSFTGQFIGDGSGLINLNASQLSSGTVPDARLPLTVARTNQVWLLNGNVGTTPASNSIGTLDNQPLILKVNGFEAMRYEPVINSPNIVGGYSGNSASGSQNYGVTIGGGGQSGLPNTITGQNVTFSTIAGGAANTIFGTDAFHSVIGGGIYNSIYGNSVYESVIAGGSDNTVQGWASVVGGGTGNWLQPSADHSIISGGFNNTIQAYGWDSVIAGGYGGLIQSNAQFSVISGGNLNTNGSSYAAIGGGYYNFIQYNNWGAFIGAGTQNTIQTGSGYSAIDTGAGNLIESNASYVVIGGGQNNDVQSYAGASVIGGGYYNTNGDPWSVIGGGYWNVIQRGDGNGGSIIGGGYFNTIASNSLNSTIAGGALNVIQSYGNISTIGGGQGNVIQGYPWYYTNYYAIASTIAGGFDNLIMSNGVGSTIGGGYANQIQSGGGVSTIGGGWANAIATNVWEGTIGGGSGNQVTASGGTVPGGFGNIAGGVASFAAGTSAHATNDGAFVLTDNQSTNFYSTASNQLSARFTGGIRFVTAGAGLTLDGQPILSSASVVGGGQLSGSYTNALTETNGGNIFAGNGSGLTGVNAATLNGLSSSAFAPAVGSSNYIQNQVSFPQPASFIITGSATIGGVASASTVSASAGIGFGGDTRTSWNNMDANSVSPLPRTLATGQVPISSGAYQWTGIPSSSANLVNSLVQRDPSGNFSAGAVTASSLVVTNVQASGLFRSGSETGTSFPPNPAGLVIRRVNSLNGAISNVIARTDFLTLERDGSNEGLLIRYPAGVGPQTINCMAQTLAGANIIVRTNLNNPLTAGTIPLVTSSQRAVHAQVSFGNTRFAGHVTQVVIDRYDDGSLNDNYWIGTLTSTWNQ